MKLHLTNLGSIRSAVLDVGKLTVVCGKNNTGKSYLAYVLFGLLDFLPKLQQGWHVLSKEGFVELKETGETSIDLGQYFHTFNSRVDQLLKRPSSYWGDSPIGRIPHVNSGGNKLLASLLAFSESCFVGTEFKLEFSSDEMMVALKEQIKAEASTGANYQLRFIKKKDDNVLSIKGMRLGGGEKLDHALVEHIVDNVFASVIVARMTSAYVITSERTGIVLFREAFLDSLKTFHDRFVQAHPPAKIESPLNYPVAVRKEIDLVASFRDHPNGSYIEKERPDIIDYFKEILGGRYSFDEASRNFHFAPDGAEARLILKEVSSSVRSLFSLGLYLSGYARPGDLLMIDEPELNLHPANQRKMARLLARLVNAGVRVFVTTHSDYLVKEFNTLIMLNRCDHEHTAMLIEKHGYVINELLNVDDIRVYEASNHTLVEMEVSRVDGIEVRSFDSEILQMNRLQDEILCG